jgi:hypothetical protein
LQELVVTAPNNLTVDALDHLSVLKHLTLFCVYGEAANATNGGTAAGTAAQWYFRTEVSRARVLGFRPHAVAGVSSGFLVLDCRQAVL